MVIFEFWGYFGHFRDLGWWGILLILEVLEVIFSFCGLWGYFSHFLGFEGILVIFRFRGYFGYFLGFRDILDI